MSSASALNRRPRARKSIAHLPLPGDISDTFDKENTANATTSLNFETGFSKITLASKKQRSRSLGPEGLGALQDDAGNCQKVGVYNERALQLKLNAVLDAFSCRAQIYPQADNTTFTPPTNTRSPERC